MMKNAFIATKWRSNAIRQYPVSSQSNHHLCLWAVWVIMTEASLANAKTLYTTKEAEFRSTSVVGAFFGSALLGLGGCAVSKTLFARMMKVSTLYNLKIVAPTAAVTTRP